MIEVITPATNKKLTTLTAVKAELGISGESEDTLLGPFIDRASAAIVAYCQRPFAKEVYKETAPGYGSSRLMLSRTPILTVASVIADSEIITDYLTEDREAGILYRKVGWRWTPALGWNVTPYPLAGQENLLFTVEYTAGYVLPGDATEGVPRTLPEDVEAACSELVKAMYLGRDRDPLMVSQRTADLQVQYIAGVTRPEDGGFPPVVVQLLAPWRRLV